LGLLRVPRLNVNKAIGIKQKVLTNFDLYVIYIVKIVICFVGRG